jgi:hypothetical protein
MRSWRRSALMTAGQKVDCRPQLVARAGSDRAVLAEFDGWIEPLQGMFARVLAENPTLLLGTDDVLTLPQRRPILSTTRSRSKSRASMSTPSAVPSSTPAGGVRQGWRGAPAERSIGDYTAAAGALSRARGAMSLEIVQALADQARNPR